MIKKILKKNFYNNKKSFWSNFIIKKTFDKSNLKNTNYIANKILSLPCWPYMTDNEVAYVVENVNKII